MTARWANLGVERFLEQYWQRRPCLIRSALPDFSPPLNGDDLAGLAGDELAESRIIEGSTEHADWRLRHGPFDASVFAELGDADWTLLVQDVEKHYPPLEELVARFDFLPSWRLDDLMVSFAAPGGSVGPHVDQYDVFLLQARGRRRWDVAAEFTGEILPDLPIEVLAEFQAQQSWILEPGDMLYLPPGIAHHGVALEPCMTFSIGFRAPTAADLVMGLGEWLSARGDQGGRYRDPPLSPAPRSGEIDARSLDALRALLAGLLNDARRLDRFFAAFLSRFRLARDPAPAPQALSQPELHSILQSGQSLQRDPWTRLNWIREGKGALLYAAGDAHECSRMLAQSVCGHGRVTLDPGDLSRRDLAVLLRLYNAGHLTASGPD